MTFSSSPFYPSLTHAHTYTHTLQFSSLQKDIDNSNVETERMKLEQQKLKAIVKSLEKDILALKKAIQERDETIQDKVSEWLG